MEGHIIAQTVVEGRSAGQEKYCLHLYSVNGRQLASVPLEEQVTALYMVPDYAIMGTSKGNLHIRDLYCLSLAVAPLALKVPVCSVSVTKESSHILVAWRMESSSLLGLGSQLRCAQASSLTDCGRSASRISQVSSESEYNPTETSGQ
ncbi:hypothetical protein SKAU_G00219340 [Synaphobranchus kaupii]|uniref:Uncharacterized protein n=1 Tax=Synaphobranchus kaupii TaxID=118154 RepID=A0A9Q1FAQ5_SYNKA|nr:hypothetical protein SKAU_G00219340 [Synaphobranchus kaupii]